MTPPMSLLRGLPVETAAKFGMPCWQARYTGRGARRYRLDDGARCLACGRPASNCHHEPHLGMGGRNASFELHGVELRPALIALCGSGTTGCHGAVHSGRMSLSWRWADEASAEAWWRGDLLGMAGSRELYRLGGWEVSRGRVRAVRAARR